VAVYTEASNGRLSAVGAALGYAGVVVLAGCIVARFAPLVPWAVALTASGYIVGRAGHHAVDGWAAVVGGTLLLAAELASWSIEHDDRIRVERALTMRRAAVVGGLVTASALVGFVLVGAAALSTSAGLLLSVVGMAAALGSVWVIVRLLRG
jgi:small-conductance mechanosensitive channel